MRLTADEEAILASRRGEPPGRVLEIQVATSEFFGAERMVWVTSAHLSGELPGVGHGQHRDPGPEGPGS